MPPKKTRTVEAADGTAAAKALEVPSAVDPNATIPASAVLAAHAATPIERKKEIENKIMSLAVGYGDTDLVHVLVALGFAECDATGAAVAQGQSVALAAAKEREDAAAAAAAAAAGTTANAAGIDSDPSDDDEEDDEDDDNI